MKKNLLLIILSIVSMITYGNYIPLPIASGYNADVIANGIGTGLTTSNNDVDGVNYVFVSNGWQNTATSTPLTWGLPANGIVNSGVAATPNLTFNLANYSNNNVLRIPTNNTSDSLVLASPTVMNKLIVLATSGSGTSYFTGQINFTDGTSQLISTPIIVPDWFNSTSQPTALGGFGRMNRTNSNLEPNANDPRLYQITLDIDPGNITKLVRSVHFTKAPTSDANAIINIFALSAYVITSNDVGISTFVSPQLFCQGNNDIVVKVKNFGNTIINSATINWTKDGVLQASTTLPQALNAVGGTGINDINVTLGSHNFLAGTPVTIKAWTSNPNGTADGYNINDTILVTIQPGLQGEYTINSAVPTGGTNFQTFAAFTSALNTYGMCGAVTANVTAGSGPYTETIKLNNFPGSSATNVLRINGNGATVQFNNDANNLHLLIFNGTKYTRVDNLNFVTQNANYGYGAIIYNNAQFDSITQCTFNLSATTSISSGNTNGIVFSNSLTSPTASGNNGSNCYIYNNQIIGPTGSGGPSYGIALTGNNTNNIIKKNQIINFYQYGIYNSAGSGNIIEENEIHRATKTSVTSFYGIYIIAGVTNLRVNANKIHSPGGTVSNSTSGCYPIYLTSVSGAAATPNYITNNLAYNLNLGGIIYGIYASASTHTKLYHNTIDIASIRTGTSTNAGIYATGTNTGMDAKNNIISITGGTLGTKHGIYAANANSIGDAQMNNIYVNSTQTGTQNYYYLTSAYATQALFQAAQPLREIGSPSVNPQYVSVATGNLLPGNTALHNAGTNILSLVPLDINGLPRSTTPTIGAFQASLPIINNAKTQAILNPTGNLCANTVPVEVVIGNAGTNDINNLIVNWSVNGVVQTPVNYTQTLVQPTSTTGQSLDTIILGNATLTVGANNIIVWTSMPNGVADTDNTNDTLSRIINTINYTLSPSTSTICATGTSTLSVSPSTGFAAGAISWEVSTDGGTTWTTIAGANATSYAVTGITTTRQYRSRFTNNGVHCYSNAVTVNVAELAITSTTGATRCGAGTVTLNAAGTGTTINWFANASGGTALYTGANFTTPILSANTTYYVSSSDGQASGCVSPRVPVAVVINEKPIVHLGNDTLICPGTSTTLNGTSPTTGVTYSWSTGATTPSINVSTAGTYIIEVSNTLCSTKDTIIVGIAPLPSTVLPDTIAICEDEQATLNAGNTGASFLWNTAATSQSITVNTAGNYTVTITNANHCFIKDTTVVLVNPLPIVDLGVDTTICQADSLVIDAENVGSSYVWNTGSTNQTITVNQAGTYSVTVTNIFNCKASDAKVINIYDGISIDGFNFTPRFDIAPGRVDFFAINPIEVTNYLWEFGDGATSTLASPSHTYTANGNYLVKLTVSNQCGSTDTSLMINIDRYLGVNVVNNDLNLNVYPVPAKDLLNVIASTAGVIIKSIRVINTIGQQVELMQNINSNNTQLNVHNLSTGHYFLNIETNQGNTIRKVEILK